MKLLPVISFLFISLTLSGQGELDLQDRTFWRNERSFGAAIYSNGWSINYAEYRQTKPDNRLFIEAGLGGYRNPKEVKIQNITYYSPYSFVYGKINLNWHLNAGFGYQHEIFEKRDLGGVSIGWYVAGGTVITFCKPIYYKIIDSVTVVGLVFEEKKFDITTMLYNDIYSKASILKGMSEINLYPGLYAHGGFNFEYSHNDKLTQTIEIGASISGYLKKIPIMAHDPSKQDPNKQIYFQLFVSYKIGFVLDPLKMRNDFLTSLFSHKEE